MPSLSPRKDGIKCQSSTLCPTGRPTPSNAFDCGALLRSLGATGKLAGFRCTVYMIERIQENPEQLQLITKRLYRETGKKFGVSAASVERNLRTLIHFCWSRTDHSFLAHIAGTDLRTPPTNSEFLDMLASYLREMGG